MNKQSNAYVVLYAAVLVVVVASVLSAVSYMLKPMQQKNIEIEKRSDILKSASLFTEPKVNYNEEVEEQYKEYIVASYLVNDKGDVVSEDAKATFTALINIKTVFASDLATRALPVFKSKSDSGELKYIFPVNGVGLWGPIWGYIALKDDFNTIAGAVFAHTSETPGLGAEISTPIFEKQFIGKEFFRDGTFEGISILKGAGASENNPNAVDAISGGTITSNAVGEMLAYCINDGYKAYIEKMRNEMIVAKRQLEIAAIAVDSTAHQTTSAVVN